MAKISESINNLAASMAGESREDRTIGEAFRQLMAAKDNAKMAKTSLASFGVMAKMVAHRYNVVSAKVMSWLINIGDAIYSLPVGESD
jgi:hypothetical protein